MSIKDNTINPQETNTITKKPKNQILNETLIENNTIPEPSSEEIKQETNSLPKAEDNTTKEKEKIVEKQNNEIQSSNSEKKSNISTFALLSITLVFIIALLAIGFSIFSISKSNNNTIISGITIKDIDVSELTTEQAKEKIETYINNNLPENIQLKHNDFETSIPMASLEIKFDTDEAIDKAIHFGKNGNFFENTFSIIKTKFDNINIEPSFSYNEDALITILNDISTKLPDTVINSSYYIEDNNLIVTKGKEGNVVNINQMTTYIKNGISNLTLKNRTLDISTKLEQPSKINIEKIYSEVHKDAVNASYTQNPFTISPSENGVDFAISLDEAKTLIESEDKEEYTIPLKVLYPSITTNMIGTEAFPDLLSSFSTKYSASAVDRTTNLRLAASKINGTVVMPGETFSYNQVVGARTIAAGYKEAPIYVQGKVVDGLGGGICQITSTLYNAVVFANLEIVERTNHQFIPSYVTASRDATVVYGAIDFKFKNNRNYPIKLVCSVSGGIASFQIFGLKGDNEYDVNISSYVTGTTSNSIYSEAYKILSQNGQVVSKELLSRDVYKRH